MFLQFTLDLFFATTSCTGTRTTDPNAAITGVDTQAAFAAALARAAQHFLVRYRRAIKGTCK